MNRFSFETISDFDNHICASIAGYDILHNLIVNLSSFFIKNYPPIDLGCTSGKLIEAINKKYNCNGIGYDITGHNFKSNLDLRIEDITSEGFEIPKTNLIFSVFTLQFIDYEKRLPLLKKIHKSLIKNGVLVVCEKEICKNGIFQEVFTFSNYDYKSSLFTPEQILEKEKDLRFIMNNLQSEENLKLFKQAGFKTIEPFFQSLNFKGYLCQK